MPAWTVPLLVWTILWVVVVAIQYWLSRRGTREGVEPETVSDPDEPPIARFDPASTFFILVLALWSYLAFGVDHAVSAAADSTGLPAWIAIPIVATPVLAVTVAALAAIGIGQARSLASDAADSLSRTELWRHALSQAIVAVAPFAAAATALYALGTLTQSMLAIAATAVVLYVAGQMLQYYRITGWGRAVRPATAEERRRVETLFGDELPNRYRLLFFEEEAPWPRWAIRCRVFHGGLHGVVVADEALLEENERAAVIRGIIRNGVRVGFEWGYHAARSLCFTVTISALVAVLPFIPPTPHDATGHFALVGSGLLWLAAAPLVWQTVYAADRRVADAVGRDAAVDVLDALRDAFQQPFWMQFYTMVPLPAPPDCSAGTGRWADAAVAVPRADPIDRRQGVNRRSVIA